MDTNSPEILPESRAVHVDLPLTQQAVFSFTFTKSFNSEVDPNGLSQKVNLLCLLRAQGRGQMLGGTISSFLTLKELLFHRKKLGTVQRKLLAIKSCLVTRGRADCVLRGEILKNNNDAQE